MKFNRLSSDNFCRWLRFVCHRAHWGYVSSDLAHNHYRKPTPSKWRIVRILDTLNSKATNDEGYTTLDLIVLWIVCPFVSSALSLWDSDWAYWCACGSIIFFVADSLLLNHFYRFFRHWYLQSHNLPGPYGSGTLNYSDEEFYIGIKEGLYCWQNGKYIELKIK